MTQPTAGFAAQVVAWQRTHGRHGLPWQCREPYRVWLSEIMLQQTQVSVVLKYYARFLDRFPDVRSLAAAPLDDVLAAWSGLGYYGRARNLHRCAIAVASVHGGAFPTTAAALQELPGIGRSTAAAIAAFCFDERAAILDGNVQRVLARAFGHGDDLAQASGVRALWVLADAALPPSVDMPAYTQGLMDLGATVCTVRQPSCLLCPVQAGCRARQDGRVAELPRHSRRTARGQRDTVWLWLWQGDRFWLSLRPATGIWAGLRSLPEFADAKALAVATAGWPGRATPLPVFTHVLTHLDWTLRPVQWHLPDALAAPEVDALVAPLGAGGWVRRPDAQALGLPAPLRRLVGATDPGEAAADPAAVDA